ncbi:MAG: DUF2793 domain-containing protein [Hyphomonadaceae bacterium]
MSNTSNLELPYLAVGQAKKHVTVNETLRRLDAVVQLTVISATVSTQPGAPAEGAVYIVPPARADQRETSSPTGRLDNTAMARGSRSHRAKAGSPMWPTPTSCCTTRARPRRYSHRASC